MQWIRIQLFVFVKRKTGGTCIFAGPPGPVTLITWIASLAALCFLIYSIDFYVAHSHSDGRQKRSNPTSSITGSETRKSETQRQPSRDGRVQSRESTPAPLRLWMTSGIRPEPSDDSPILAWAPEGARLRWHSRVGEYYEVVYDNRIAYIKENLVEPEYRRRTNPLETGPLSGVVVTGRNCALRTQPSAYARIKARIPNGVVLRVFSEVDSYYTVFYSGRGGFLRKSATDPSYR